MEIEKKASSKLRTIYEVIFIILGILLMIGLSGNNNYNPNSFIERILPPIRVGSGLFYYENILLLIGIYYLIKRLYSVTGHNLLTTRFRRIIAVFVIMSSFRPIYANKLDTYRSWQKGVEAMTLDRENMSLDIEIEQRGMTPIRISGNMQLENHGDEPASFQIKVKLPMAVREIVGQEYLEIKEVYKINAKKKEEIHFEQELMEEVNQIQGMDEDFEDVSMAYSEYEFSIYDNQEEVSFEASNSAKYFWLDKPYF